MDIAKRRRWNAIFRLFQAKSDKEMIATWMLDLSKILGVFNVRFITSVRSLLTTHLQTELVMTQNAVVSGVLQGVVTTRTTV